MENQIFLMNLPTNVIVEILARLPAKTIIQCKTVCKTCLQLITNPHFISLHFSLSRPALIVHHSEMFKNFFRLVDFEDSHDHHHLPHQIMATFDFATLTTSPDANIVIDGSVNGLLLLRDVNYKHEALYISNPLTREYFQLPRPDGVAVRYPMVVTHGFGVTRHGGEYKVVRILHQRDLDPRNGHCVGVPFSECRVYSFRKRAWRHVGDGPARFVYDSRMIGLFFRGNIHWLVRDLEGFELISCFDLENERFRRLPGPFSGRRVLGSLGVLRGCLALCDNSDYKNIDIWVMKEYNGTWAKEIVVGKMPELVGPSFEIVHALKVFEDGNVLILWGDFFMFCYCSKSDVAEEVDLDQGRGPNSIEAIQHVPTFLSLKSFVGENVCVF